MDNSTAPAVSDSGLAAVAGHEDDELTRNMRRVLRDTSELTFKLCVTLWGPGSCIEVTKPGATDRSKPIRLLPLIFGAEGDKHSDVLQLLVDVLREEGR